MLTKTELRKEVEKAYSSYKPEELFFDNSFKPCKKNITKIIIKTVI